MGIYTKTEYRIECDSEETALKVAEVIRSMDNDEHGNDFDKSAEANGSEVFGVMDSGRTQNLEYKCSVVWEKIKDIDGVEVGDFPFMAETEGKYFEN